MLPNGFKPGNFSLLSHFCSFFSLSSFSVSHPLSLSRHFEASLLELTPNHQARSELTPDRIYRSAWWRGWWRGCDGRGGWKSARWRSAWRPVVGSQRDGFDGGFGSDGFVCWVVCCDGFVCWVWVGFGWRLGGVWVGVGWLDLGPVVVNFSDGLGDLFRWV